MLYPASSRLRNLTTNIMKEEIGKNNLCPTTFWVITDVDPRMSLLVFSTASNSFPAKQKQKKMLVKVETCTKMRWKLTKSPLTGLCNLASTSAAFIGNPL